ncbi:MAG TPA: RpiB/LacA/LacB family sugar-phosphate isomerase [Candidatus Saccharimonadales bacterium]|nr:RpiB/LacA/LacB family sugar-phosphate isomerase [Candidatus Saccharimonadales bacterium]
MKIYVGADHQGFYLRNSLISYLKRAGYEVEDEGDKQLDPSDDFPVFTQKVVSNILSSDDNDPRGILICSSGQGMCMAANRFKGIRAALGYNKEAVRSSRNDDNSNILCLPAKVLEKDEANVLVELWLNTPFAGAPRFVRRLREIDEFET